MSHNGGCCHGHSPSAKDVNEFGLQYNLNTKINMSSLECFNEKVNDSAKRIFNSWDNRLQKSHCVESDCNDPPELLINIPFTGDVKLKGVIIIGGEDSTHPSSMKLFKNASHVTFDDLPTKADQTFDLVRDENGVIEYSVKPVVFSSVYHLTIHIPGNLACKNPSYDYDDDIPTKVYYIGLKGDFVRSSRDAVVTTVYESRPMIGDHKQDVDDLSIHQNPGF